MYKYSLLILVCLIASALIGVIYELRAKFNRQMGLLFLICLVAMLVFNTYLTALPIVVYNTSSILGLRIITFPIEDIGYLIAVVVLLPSLYNKLKDAKKDTRANQQKKR